MDKLIGFEIRNYDIPIKSNYSNLNEDVLQLSFILDRNIDIIINSKGEIICCDNLTIIADDIDYYISIEESLKKIKNFCENKGRQLFAEVENIENRSNKFYVYLYNDEKIQIEKLKEEYNYNDLQDNYYHLMDTIKTFKELRFEKEDNIKEYSTRQIKSLEMVIERLKNKLYEYGEKKNKIREKTRIEKEKIKEEKYKILKEVEKEYNKYL